MTEVIVNEGPDLNVIIQESGEVTVIVAGVGGDGLADHLGDTTGAHAASAISFSAGGTIAATDVQAAIEEVASEGGGGGGGGVTDHGALTGLSDDDHPQYHNNTRGDVRYYTKAQVDTSLGGKADATALTAHIDDTTDAHDASAISYAGGTGIAATDVEAAIDELATEKSDTGHTHNGLAPSGGSTGQVLKKTSATDYDYAWSADSTGGGGAASAAVDVTYDGSTNLSATNVEAALDELDTEKASTGSVSAVATSVSDHLADTSDAHDASAISIADAGANYTATDVEAALAEEADARQAHEADATAAHAATAISYAGSTTLAATDVEGALDELDTEKASTGSVTTVSTSISDHLADTSDAHDASAISILDSGANYAATDVEAALAEEADARQAHEANTSNPHSVTAAQAGAVPTTRTVSTTAPLTGGGDLSANRTLAVSAASDTASGVVELATSAETTTGTDTVRATTPAGVKAVSDTLTPTARTISTTAPLTGGGDLSANRTLAVSAASSTAQGVVELATDAETTTGTDTARATTPANVKAAIDARTASSTAAGIVELATDAETTTGTDTARATTPANVKAAINTVPREVVFGRKDLVTGAIPYRWMAPYNITIVYVKMTVWASSSSGSITADVNRALVASPATWTTMYTTQGNRPTIVATGLGTQATLPDVLTLSAGDYLGVDLDAIGTGANGVEVQIGYKLT